MRGDLSFGQEHLRLAETILRRGGFAVSTIQLSANLTLLVAENDYFVLGVVVASSLEELLQMESSLSVAFVNRLAEQAAGPKQWDAYLVLLTPDRAVESNEEVAELAAINRDTRYLRRLAHVGVTATSESVERALRPFLPLPPLKELDTGVDALTLLEQELPRYGIEPDQVTRLLARYRTSGVIDDA